MPGYMSVYSWVLAGDGGLQIVGVSPILRAGRRIADFKEREVAVGVARFAFRGGERNTAATSL